MIHLRLPPFQGALLIGILALSGPLRAQTFQSDQPHELNILEVMGRAEHVSPVLKAALARMKAAQESIRIAKSAYFPALNLEGIDSTGFPGSSNLLGISGLMASPFRSGLAGGIVSKLTVYDFGRTRYDVKAAEQELISSFENVKVLRYLVYLTALKLYFDAVQSRSQQETWQQLGQETSYVAHEVRRFVQTGQRSIVERYLVQDQVEEADATQAAYGERYSVALRRLALLTGLNGPISCPDALHVRTRIYDGLHREEQSPLLRRAAAESSTAHERLKQVLAENRPQIMAVASAGEMDKSRLVEKKEYSAAVGFQLPLFEGYKITAEVHRAQNIVDQKDQELISARFELDDQNASYDEIINSARVNLQHLEHELAVANEGFKVAKERYLSFQGTLVDVREALRNLSRIMTTIDEVRVDLLIAEGSKRVLNGAYVENDIYQ